MPQDLAGIQLGEPTCCRPGEAKRKWPRCRNTAISYVEGATLPRCDGARWLKPCFEQNWCLFAEYCFQQEPFHAYGRGYVPNGYLKAHFPVAYMAGLLTGPCRQHPTGQRISPTAGRWASR